MTRLTGIMLMALLLGGCVIEDDADHEAPVATSQQPAPAPAATPAPAPATPAVRLEVHLAQRRVNVYRGDQQIGSYPAAVGSEKWPTPTGEWTIDQVIFNPRWVPPKEEAWAEDEEIAEPGDPDNPLGVAQLVYRAPNSIHGTDEEESLGKAVSHGSVRVSNNVAVALAKLVMKAGGAQQDEAWVAQALRNKTERAEVNIPRPVPIRVY